MTRLPATGEDLRGLRAARWIRESTAGQFDRYGPDAQRELQDRSVRRFGLVDTGLAWSAAQSGATVHSSAKMRAMLDAAIAGEFEVLLGSRSSGSGGCTWSRPRQQSRQASWRRSRVHLLVMVGARGFEASVDDRSAAAA